MSNMTPAEVLAVLDHLAELEQGLPLGRQSKLYRKIKSARTAVAALIARVKELESATAVVPARALAEWHEDDGNVMWFAWCGHEWAGEPAWCGRPDDSDWPGYHTHWVPHPKFPPAVDAASAEAVSP
jgi:hypothetical protein